MDSGSMMWFSAMNEHEGGPLIRPFVGARNSQCNQVQVNPSNSTFRCSFDLPFSPSCDRLIDELLASSSGNEVDHDFSGNKLVENMEDYEFEDNKKSAAVTNSLQKLETNYERKKNRAKINRKDLNERFQELMSILQLREDRKLNRAKVLEKTIEHIRSLTNEVQILRARLGETSTQGHTATAKITQVYPPHPSLPPTIAPIPILSVMPRSWNSQSSGAIYLPYTIHSAPTCSQALSNHVPQSHSVHQWQVDLNEQRQLDAKRRQTCKFSILIWVAREIPAMLMLLDAFALAKVMLTCKELKKMCHRQDIWINLCRKRWFLRDSKPKDPCKQWKQLDSANKLPHLTSIDNGLAFAYGKSKRIHTWTLLSKRSNGHTTRTVLMNGRAVVMQVVELYVVIQNMSHHRVRLMDSLSIQVTSRSSSAHVFDGLASKFGSHLKPRLLSLNDSIPTSDQLIDCVLLHGDVAVLSAYFECKDLDLEEEFLQSVHHVSIQCQVENYSNMSEGANICEVNAINTFTKDSRKQQMCEID